MKQLDVDKLHEGIDMTIQGLRQKEVQLCDMEVALTNFVNLDVEFRGQGGQAIRNFFATCHIPFIQSLRLFTQDYEHALQNIKESLYLVEPAPGGFIDQAFLEGEVQDGLNRASQTTMSLTDSVNDTLRSIQDIIAIPLIDDSDVQQAIKMGKDFANETVDKVLQFDHKGAASLQSIKENLQTLGKYVMEMHDAMDGGHLSVKDFSVTQLQHLPTHGTLTEVLKNRASHVAQLPFPNERLTVLDMTTLESLAHYRAALKARELVAEFKDIYHSAVEIGKEKIEPLKNWYMSVKEARRKRAAAKKEEEEEYDWCGEHGCYSLDDFTFGSSYDSTYGFSSRTLRKKGMGYIDAETAQAIVAFQEGIENGDIVIEADSPSYDDEDIFQGQIRAAKEGYDYFTGKEISEKEAKQIILTAQVGATINAFNPIMGIRKGHKNISVRRANGGNVNNKTSNVFSSQGRVTVDKIKSNPSAFKGKSTDDIAQMLRDNGYDVEIRKSKRSSSGAEIIKINNHGNDRNITQVQVSPGGGRHGNNPYVKISTSDEGIIKVVDGSLNNYLTDGTEKASIIFTGGK
ncbi:LXG domain-containing protein [Salipaludibacillus sp. LMS25]|uniref:LXG domain-containing protein n=1 Tax=Salipaludibacillus sp. LMS25 TaxID=2924031 RepID=UPI0020D12062|nr:LXG domain-containing protein [Salipaludibacillus sp. LMS25]UTR15702.1 LXG domain-containing protein [Salipaludibacillus sp. LMS25]